MELPVGTSILGCWQILWWRVSNDWAARAIGRTTGEQFPTAGGGTGVSSIKIEADNVVSIKFKLSDDKG